MHSEKVFAMKDTELILPIYRELYMLGFAADFTGFFYTSYAVFLTVKRPDCILYAGKWLYPDVAEQYETTTISVEKNIKNIVDITWNSHLTDLESIANRKLAVKPTVPQFLSILASGIINNRAA